MKKNYKLMAEFNDEIMPDLTYPHSLHTGHGTKRS